MSSNRYFNNGKILSVVTNGESLIFYKEESEELYKTVLELCKAKSYDCIKELQTLSNLDNNLAKIY